MKYSFLFLLFFLVSCGVQNKNADLMSPCAGCDDRVFPIGNAKYLA